MNIHKEKKNKCYKVKYSRQATSNTANFDKISHIEYAKETYDILIKYYKGGDKVNGVKLQSLRRQYELLQMEMNENITTYASNIQGLVHTMKNHGEVMIKKMVIGKVIRTLNLHFDCMIIVYRVSRST